MNYQDNETAVVIEKEIECLNSYEKIDQFIGLCNFHHLHRCENIDCSNCKFILNFRYMYVENITDQKKRC